MSIGAHHCILPQPLKSCTALSNITWSFSYFCSVGCTSFVPSCPCLPLLSSHPLLPRVHNHPLRVAFQIRNGPHYWGIFSISTRLSGVVAFRQRIVYLGEMIALSMMVRTSASTCLAATMMLVVCRLLTPSSSAIFSKSSLYCARLHQVHLSSGLSFSHPISITTEFASRALLSCQYAGELPTLGEVLAP
jgi:hypothetical protein